MHLTSIRSALDLGTIALLVTYRDGYYSLSSAAEAEEWSAVVNALDGEVTHVIVEPLTGWGEYAHAVHLIGGRVSCVYFVAPDPRCSPAAGDLSCSGRRIADLPCKE